MPRTRSGSKKKLPARKSNAPASTGSGKRKSVGSGRATDHAPKKAKTASKEKPAGALVINKAPKNPLSVFVFGTGECGELGLGPKEKTALRARLSPYLDPSNKATLHAVQVACGIRHTVALTTDNQIVTWGVNDHGALGRDTQWINTSKNKKLMNPLESIPTAIPAESVPSDARFVQIAAGNSCSFALTDTGEVYGWGTFLSSSGDKRFSYDAKGECTEQQDMPVKIPGLENITQLVCGANHALALDNSGSVWTWGAGELGQLGRRLNGQQQDGLKPQVLQDYAHKVKYIASGEYHSFVVDSDDNVWSWGSNSFGEAGQAMKTGDATALVSEPMKIEVLSGLGVKVLDGGAQHSVAITAKGECFAWGRIDGGQLGIEFTASQLEDDTHVQQDEHKNPVICLRPTPVPYADKAAFVACGTNHTIVLNKEGHAFATGFGSGGRLGLGKEEDVNEMSRVGGTIKNRKLSWAGAGGQFSVVTAVYQAPEPKPRKKWETGDIPTWFEIW